MKSLCDFSLLDNVIDKKDIGQRAGRSSSCNKSNEQLLL